MKSIITVADNILKVFKRNGVQINSMKLIKIAIMAQAHHLYEHGEPLFPDEIQAWAYGPNIQNLYIATRIHKLNPISFADIEGPLTMRGAELETIEKVIVKYGAMTPVQLSAILNCTQSAWNKSKIEGQIKIIQNDDLKHDALITA